MSRPHLTHFLIVGAGAAGLMVGRELSRAGKKVTILEARDRCGGRIHPLPAEQFGYPAEGGAEFVDGTAAITRGLIREARLSVAPMAGTRWSTRSGTLSRSMPELPHADRLHEALAGLKHDLPMAEFLEQHFADRQFSELRREITRMLEATTRPTRPASAPLRCAMNGWTADWVRRDGSSAAMARSSSFSPRTAGEIGRAHV